MGIGVRVSFYAVNSRRLTHHSGRQVPPHLVAAGVRKVLFTPDAEGRCNPSLSTVAIPLFPLQRFVNDNT